MSNLLFAPGTQAHYDHLIEHRRQVLAGEIPSPVATMESVCEHEAAHAVVSTVLGVTFEEYRVLPMDQWRDGESCGGSGSKITGATAEETAIKGCAILWAGAIADGHLLGATLDIDTMMPGLARLPESKRGLPFSLAADIVTRNRAAIKEAAARLAAGGRITYDEIVAILDAAN